VVGGPQGVTLDGRGITGLIAKACHGQVVSDDGWAGKQVDAASISQTAPQFVSP
jgi:hypothetical protein